MWWKIMMILFQFSVQDVIHSSIMGRIYGHCDQSSQILTTSRLIDLLSDSVLER